MQQWASREEGDDSIEFDAIEFLNGTELSAFYPSKHHQSSDNRFQAARTIVQSL